MAMLPKTSRRLETLMPWVLALWVVLVFHHYFSWTSIFDFSFVSTALWGFERADIRKWTANWLHFLVTLGVCLWIGFVLWRMGVKFLRWTGAKAGNGVLTFCLEMALGILGLNALWLGLGFNQLWNGPLLWVLALLLGSYFAWDFYRGLLKTQRFPRWRLPGKLDLALGFLRSEEH